MPPSKRRLQQYAIAISIISVFYNGAEGALSIGFGAESSSRSLIFFGIQSVVEVVSAIVVIWRFKNLAKPGEEKQRVLGAQELAFEKHATFVIGILLLVLCLTTEGSSIASLALHQEPDASNASLIISASALVLMVLIWLPKRYLAQALDSSAMQGEATCSLSCIQITVVLFAGSLIFRLWRGGWWVDAATAIILGLLFGWEGIKMVRWARDPAFTGGCCNDCKPRTALDLELGEQHRDICGCCSEKEDCRESETCKCSFVEQTEKEEPQVPVPACCIPINPSGEVCCTRAILPGPRPDVPSAAVVPQPDPPEKGCFSAEKDGASEGPACCSQNPEQPGHNVQDTSTDTNIDAAPSHSVSLSLPAESPGGTTKESGGCCAGCRSSD